MSRLCKGFDATATRGTLSVFKEQYPKWAYRFSARGSGLDTILRGVAAFAAARF